MRLAPSGGTDINVLTSYGKLPTCTRLNDLFKIFFRHPNGTPTPFLFKCADKPFPPRIRYPLDLRRRHLIEREKAAQFPRFAAFIGDPEIVEDQSLLKSVHVRSGEISERIPPPLRLATRFAVETISDNILRHQEQVQKCRRRLAKGFQKKRLSPADLAHRRIQDKLDKANVFTAPVLT